MRLWLKQGNKLRKPLSVFVISVLCPVVVGLAVFFLTEQRSELTYITPEVIPWVELSNQGQVKKISATYTVSLGYEGRDKLPDVRCHIEVPGGEIEEVRIHADPTIVQDKEQDQNPSTFDLILDRLNPGDEVTFILRASSTKSLPATPIVDISGDGVKAVRVQLVTDGTPTLQRLLYAISAALTLAVIVMLGFLYYLFRTLALSRSGRGPVEASEIRLEAIDIKRHLSDVYRQVGLESESQRISRIKSDTSFGKEAGYLAKRAITSVDQEFREKAKAALEKLSRSDGVSDRSRATILFSRYTIAVAENDDNAMSFLDEARKRDEAAVSRLLEDADPEGGGQQ